MFYLTKADLAYLHEQAAAARRRAVVNGGRFNRTVGAVSGRQADTAEPAHSKPSPVCELGDSRKAVG